MSDIDKTLCDEALKIVQGARREKYDKPERNFERIALAWQAITDRAYTAQEVALMFVALKLVRESHSHQRDNLVDGIGYLLCADAVIPKDSEKSAYKVQQDWRAKAWTTRQQQASQQSDAKSLSSPGEPCDECDQTTYTGPCNEHTPTQESVGSCNCHRKVDVCFCGYPADVKPTPALHPAATSFREQWGDPGPQPLYQSRPTLNDAVR